MVPTANTFREALELKLSAARSAGKEYVDVLSKDLHETVGGYPKPNRMSICCSVMQQMMKPSDKVLSSPPKGEGATLKIRYYL